jgi:archaellum component FlaG (FlaF/FlaG flagellin family)
MKVVVFVVSIIVAAATVYGVLNKETSARPEKQKIPN